MNSRRKERKATHTHTQKEKREEKIRWLELSETFNALTRQNPCMCQVNHLSTRGATTGRHVLRHQGFASTGTMRQNWPGGRRRESRPIGSAGMKTAPLRASQRSCSQIHHEALLLAARLSAGPGRLGERIWQQRRGQGVDLGARKVQGSANWAWSWRPLHHPLCWVCMYVLDVLFGLTREREWLNEMGE